jgi:hypothetical protein
MSSILKRLAWLSVASVLLAACGESEQDRATKEKYRKALAEYGSDLKKWKKDQVAYDECIEAMGDFRESLKDLEGRLGVGLNYEDYTDRVGDASAIYNQSDFQSGGLDCLTRVGVPLENALEQYTRAYNIWNDCIGDFDCDQDSIDSDLQRHWSKAGTQILKSDTALEDFKVGPRPQRPARPKGV